MVLRNAVIALEVLVGFSAVAGGIYALLGAPGVPRAWLEGSPLRSYRLPGVVLVLVVGGTSSVAARLLLAGNSQARLLSVLAGIVVLAWAGVEMMYLTKRHWSHWVPALIGLAIVVLAALLPAPG
jgi:hypothetical protein